MLIDDFLPEYDFHERHQTFVPAPKDARPPRRPRLASPDSSRLWRWLVSIRGLGSPQGAAPRMGRINRLPLPRRNGGRGRLRPSRPLLVTQRTRGYGLPANGRTEFRSLTDPRYAVAAMNILVESECPPAVARASTPRPASAASALRLAAASGSTRLIIRPFSGLLRHAMLRGIRAEAVRNVQHARLETRGPNRAETPN